MKFDFDIEPYSWKEGFIKSTIYTILSTAAIIFILCTVISIIGDEHGMTNEFQSFLNWLTSGEQSVRVVSLIWIGLYLVVAVFIKCRDDL